MADKITIEFYLTSQNSRKLWRIAKQFGHYKLVNDFDDPCQISVEKDSTEDFKRFVYLWDIVRKYKTTAMYVGDQLLTREQAEAAINWIRCCNNREFFPDQTDYCCISPGFKDMHGWGCKWLHSVLRHRVFGRHTGVYWYRMGPFDGKVQYIDKQDIKDKLAAEAESKCLSLCPLFSIEKACRFVDLLPDQIDPSIDENWEYDISEAPESAGQKIGVKPIEVTIFDLLGDL